MYTIRCEQFLLAREDDNVPPDRTLIYVQNFTPIPVGQPNGQPGLLQIGTMLLELVLDEKERATLHELTAPRGSVDGGLVEGDPQPDGVYGRRCGRLQPHPSHTWLEPGGETPESGEAVEDLVWCDGRPPFADDVDLMRKAGAVGEPTDVLPPATSQDAAP